MKRVPAEKFLFVPAVLCLAGTLASCSPVENPDDPGFNKPAVTGVIKGDITTWEGYGEALEKENRRANRDGPRWNDGFSDEF